MQTNQQKMEGWLATALKRCSGYVQGFAGIVILNIETIVVNVA
ncbi:hypothetical protein O9992_09560 [Vibrio lentus]|nr:hypothetical protein [Vibrio lentus]